MDVMLQHHGAKRVFPVPEGLRELCIDISREVLRTQPINTYEFIADYLDALLHTRETARVAARIISDLLDQSVSYEASWKRRGIGMDEVNRAAIVLQAAYRGFVTRKYLRLMALPPEVRDIVVKTGLNLDTVNDACIRIQAAFRGYRAKKIFEAEKATRIIVMKYGIDADTANRSCCIIQALVRGHLGRIYVRTHTVPEGAIEDENVRLIINRILLSTHTSWEAAVAAAITIQRFFKQVRAKLRERPPGEPQQFGKRPDESKDSVEASAGPLGLSHGEIQQLAEQIVMTIVAKATGYEELSESEEVAHSILDILLSNISGSQTTEQPPPQPMELKAQPTEKIGDHGEDSETTATTEEPPSSTNPESSTEAETTE